MSLNWKEMELILKEAELEGSKIQGVVQNTFHSITWELYSRERGRFSFYTEVGTPHSRIHLVNGTSKTGKTKKLQRFVQFARKNLEGGIITSCRQLPFDRVVVWDLNNHDRLLRVYIRLYSGPGANIIVTDSENKILDLLLRRPGRDEVSGEIFTPETRTAENGEYTVRPYPSQTESFNSFIERTYSQEQTEDTLEQLRRQAQNLMQHRLSRLDASIKSAERTLQENSAFEELLYEADLLSASSWAIKRGDSSVELTDWTNGNKVLIPLNTALSPGDNVKALYEKYQKAKGAYSNASDEARRLRAEYESVRSRFERALEATDSPEADIKRLKTLLAKAEAPAHVHTGPGLRAVSGGWTLLVGRNSKENDELLRHYAKGNDMWFHTRDFPGGYVFVKYRKDKTIPLEVMLDAANLAVLFSKGRSSGSVDLYYTQVKYLRRAKNGKQGLVLPTQEKNLTIKPDRSRVNRLLPKAELQTGTAADAEASQES